MRWECLQVYADSVYIMTSLRHMMQERLLETETGMAASGYHVEQRDRDAQWRGRERAIRTLASQRLGPARAARWHACYTTA